MGEVEGISEDTVLGMAAMVAYTGVPQRKLYHLATKGQLPGAFRLGRNWALLKSVYVADLRARALRGTAQAEAA